MNFSMYALIPRQNKKYKEKTGKELWIFCLLRKTRNFLIWFVYFSIHKDSHNLFGTLVIKCMINCRCTQNRRKYPEKELLVGHNPPPPHHPNTKQKKKKKKY